MKKVVKSFILIDKILALKLLNFDLTKELESKFLNIQNFFHMDKVKPLKIYLKRDLDKYATSQIIGYYYKNNVNIFCPETIDYQELIKVIAHEYVHYIHSHFKSWKRTPLWLAEGLARVLAKQEIDKKMIYKKEKIITIESLEECKNRAEFINIGGFTFSQIYVNYLIYLTKNDFLNLLKFPKKIYKFINNSFQNEAIAYYLKEKSM